LPSTSTIDSTKAQQGSITTDTVDNELTDDATYEDANPYWTALKIVRQNTSKGKTKYLIKWANPDYPDTWTDASNVTDELKRRFYLTHTKAGTKRKTPLEDVNYQSLECILNMDESIEHVEDTPEGANLGICN